MALKSAKNHGFLVEGFPAQSFSGAALSSAQPQEEEEHHRPDKRRDDSVDPKVDMKGDVGRLENPTADERADHADHNIADETEASTPHDLASEPARDEANHQGDDQRMFLHDDHSLRYV